MPDGKTKMNNSKVNLIKHPVPAPGLTSLFLRRALAAGTSATYVQKNVPLKADRGRRGFASK